MTTAHAHATSTAPALELATMDEWWRLTGRYNSYREHSHALLKDYGYMRLMDLVDTLRPERALEFGHGFNPTLLAHAQSECEMHGIDDDQGLVYFPSGDEWNDLYDKCITPACPECHLHRGLLGHEHDLEPGSFDLIASVSVLEELDQKILDAVVADAARLLKPGGLLAGTFDILLASPDHIQNLRTACDRAGLRVAPKPPALDDLAWNGLLIENPSVVMCTYQMGQPDDRTYSGHWTACWFVAEKPA